MYDLEKLDKGARPIVDSEIYDFVKSIASDCWNDSSIIMSISDKEKFKNTYIEQIKNYKYTQLSNIDNFKNCYVTDGVTGAFLDWYSLYGIDNIYVLPGEYPFHERNGCKVVDNVDKIPNDKYLILSMPFSATGNIHEEYDLIVEQCKLRNITLLLDSAYLNISALGNVDISYAHAVSTSLSKVYSTGTNKIGILLTNESKMSPVAQLDEWHYLNHYSMNIHLKLFDKFELSYIFDKYSSKQDKVNKSLGLRNSNTLLFGISKDTKWQKYSRDGVTNRVCISKILQY